jgi:predicted nucleic acid-binding Zn ribbon protein
MTLDCPHCKKPIEDDDALLCLYCGESLGRSAGFLSGIKQRRYRALLFLAIFFILAAFILLLVF